MTKEEAIAVKLQAKNHEAEEKLNATKEKLAKVSAELVTEEMKNKEISDTNIFGRPRKIEVTAQEYRSWQKSAETKEHNELIQADIIKNAFKDFFAKFKTTFFKRFDDKHQAEVISVIQEMPIDDVTADRLFKYGFSGAEKFTVGEILERAEAEDIKDALHEAGAGYRQIKMADIEAIKEGITNGENIDNLVSTIAEQASQRIVARRTR